MGAQLVSLCAGLGFGFLIGLNFWEFFWILWIHQQTTKGASGKGPRQKTSKIVKKCQNIFRHFSRMPKNVKNRQKVSKIFSTWNSREIRVGEDSRKRQQPPPTLSFLLTISSLRLSWPSLRKNNTRLWGWGNFGAKNDWSYRVKRGKPQMLLSPRKKRPSLLM